MAHTVQGLLYKNISFMEAFEAASKKNITSVEFDGSFWNVDGKSIECKPETLSKIRSLFKRIIHALCKFFSCSYRKRFNNAVKLLDKAFVDLDQKPKKIIETKAAAPSIPAQVAPLKTTVSAPPQPAAPSFAPQIAPLKLDEGAPTAKEQETPPKVVEKTDPPPIEVLPTSPIFELNEPSVQFLSALEKVTSFQMRQIWEALLSNLSMKYGDNVLDSFEEKNATITLIFKKQLRFWMPASDENGDVHPKAFPEGGVLFTFGDKKKKLTLNPVQTAESSNIQINSGWQVLVRLPKNWIWITKIPFSPIKEWAEVQTLSMSIFQNKVETVGGKEVLGIMRKEPVIKPFEKTLHNWQTQGEFLTDPLVSSEKFLSDKRVKCGFK